MCAETLKGIYDHPQSLPRCPLFDDFVRVTNCGKARAEKPAGISPCEQTDVKAEQSIPDIMITLKSLRNLSHCPNILKDFRGSLQRDRARYAEYEVLDTDHWRFYVLKKTATYTQEDRSMPWSLNPAANVYLQVTKDDKFARLVKCATSSVYGSPIICEHWVDTELGLLTYRDHRSMKFEPERWQRTTDSIVELISSWRVEESRSPSPP